MADDLRAKLVSGIAAAKEGNKVEARQLLQQVIREEPNNEVAWMWLGSCMTTINDRRRCFEKVLEINPDNETAIAAIKQLDEVAAATAAQSQTRARASTSQTTGEFGTAQRVGQWWLSTTFRRLRIAIPILLVLAVGYAILVYTNNFLDNRARQQAVALLPTVTPFGTPYLTPTPSQTNTPPVMILSPDAVSTLPATFTPIPTIVPSNTPFPTSTALPFSSYGLYYSALEPGRILPQIYFKDSGSTTIRSTGLEANSLIYSPDGQYVAFTINSALRPTAMPTLETVEIEPTAEIAETIEGDFTPIPTEGIPGSVEEPPTPEGGFPTETPSEPTTAPAILPTSFVPTFTPVPDVASRPPDTLVEIYIALAADIDNTFTSIAEIPAVGLSGLTWSPFGNELAYIRNGYILETVSFADGINPQFNILLGDPDTGAKSGLTWSPDGSTIVYSSDVASPGFQEIFAFNVSDGSLTQLTNDAGNSYAPVYSPDGSKIAFVSDRSGDGDIYVMDADGSAETLLTVSDNGAEDKNPIFAPNGAWVAFSSNRTDGIFQIFVVRPNGTELQQVTDGDTPKDSPAFSPDIFEES